MPNMMLGDVLVSIGLPVRNGERTIEGVVRSVLAQDHGRLELVISDNASTDGTEKLCRKWAAFDKRVVYHRQNFDIGILANFIHTMRAARGEFFRWIGDDDWIAPNYISQCLKEFSADSRLLLVTTQILYTRPDGSTFVQPYTGNLLRSASPLRRFEEFSSLLAGEMLIDPLYGLIRRSGVAELARRNTIREDEIFATRLALAGPWGHVPMTLAHRHLKYGSVSSIARRLGVPFWQAYVANSLQCWEMLREIEAYGFSPEERRRARLAVARLYMRRHYRSAVHRARRFARLLAWRPATPRFAPGPTKNVQQPK